MSKIERPDIIKDKGNKMVSEATTLEGWKGLALPPKKGAVGYYQKTNPDLPLLLQAPSTVTKIGILKNGVNPSLRVIKHKTFFVTLVNTCSFDATCQLFATSYSDSTKYKAAINQSNTVNKILGVAKYLATKGVNNTTYKKSQLIKKEFQLIL